MVVGLGEGQKQFRLEIVQLRAIAVASVVLFHLKVPGLAGGFVGVDIFFVISGYLITGNILREAGSGHFSFGAFYLRRMRRIFPALIFTVAATYLAGMIWCAPSLFLDIAKECTHALLSIANIQYWREASHYFAAKSDELVLLHCWSLSLEEQFYFIWPALLVFAIRTNSLGGAILIVSIGSFAATAWLGSNDSSATFFLMPFRIFEFGCGALVLFAVQVRSGLLREVVGAGGFVAVAASVLALRSDMPRQDLLMLVPCAGAAAVIWAGDEVYASKLLRNSGVIGLGTISYSLYLCHWPIIFFARFIFGEAAAGTAIAIVAILASMLLVATAMYLMIEQRFIQIAAAPARPWRLVARYCTVGIALVALTHLTFLSKGFAWRISQSVIADGKLDGPSTIDQIAWPAGSPIVDLAGDSHAEMYVAGMLPLAASLGGNVRYVGTAGCPIVIGASIRSRRRADCLRVRDEQIAQLKAQSRPLIFVQRWETYDDAAIDYDGQGAWPNQAESFAKLEAALSETLSVLTPVRRVLLLGAQVPASCEINRRRLLQGPLPHVPPRPCAPMSKAKAAEAGAVVNAMLAKVQAKFPGRVEFLRPIDYLCNAKDGGCPVVHDGHWLYWDATHFTLAGSAYMVERAQTPLRKFISQSAPVARAEN